MTDKENHDQTLREIFAPHGEEALKNHIAQNIRAANAMAGKFDIEDPRTIIDRLEAGETLDDLINELLPHSEDAE
ncbi:hypothetical protein SAMN02745947_05223 [Rhodococcus rhodochrous J3]|uniref:Uncharacterized protein n=1 Tax=Rhodococcus rhodochrous J3 TaxID=903528 RepID=A0ABY1MIE5_RHORH|nr:MULTISPECIES: hypothetical protein [Rhodococcus]AOD24628.1 hypothetical protein IM25_22950 [Rhodococcus sp. p52]PND50079.1 hypothetical protein CQZ88_21375 [Rhodococcus sp. ENV425]TWH52655.1 hypothetical protein L612_002000000660 [Rhodococcus rhodochrous J38]UTT51189.1 hypothetical protein NMQ04_22685 [Rhodococcus gordoniae]WAL49940.1 hypothetical protein OQN32_28850 [Rhodococcus pyridinivorans]